MSYGHAYVAQVAFGANMNQVVKALREAESFPRSLDRHRVLATASPTATSSGAGLTSRSSRCRPDFWPLYRFDPRRMARGAIRRSSFDCARAESCR